MVNEVEILAYLDQVTEYQYGNCRFEHRAIDEAFHCAIDQDGRQQIANVRANDGIMNIGSYICFDKKDGNGGVFVFIHV
jgi:hypothetical protein